MKMSKIIAKLFIFIVTALGYGFTALPVTAANAKPNIIYIISDDQGWHDIGYHDNQELKTPNIDQLAASGVKFQQFYSQNFCSQTRAALMTGRYPFRYGLQTSAIPSAMTYGLPTDEYLLPQALKAAGYETVLVGKWHLGHADKKYWPMQRGFDHAYGPMIGELDYFTHQQHGVTDWFRDNKTVKEEGYTTTLLGNEAVKTINEHNTKVPLFLDISFNAPHTPYQAPQEYLDKYKNIKDPSMRAYYGAITAMDDEIGRVIAALDKKHMRDNTLIIFQSDNGGVGNPMFAGELDMSKIKIPNDNSPFRDGKGSLYEGGSRVIMLANWPGHIKAGTTVAGMVHEVDMYPTLVTLAGGKFDTNKPLDGMDMWPTISQGQPSPRNEIVYSIEGFRAAVREGDWKLIWKVPLPQKLELYNLATDPSEKTNVAAEHPEIVARLQKRIEALAQQSVPSLFMQAVFNNVRKGLHAPPAIPGDIYNIDDD